MSEMLHSLRAGAVSDREMDADAIRAASGEQILDADRIVRINGVTTWDRLFPNRMIFVERDDERIAEVLTRSVPESILVIAVDAYRDVLTCARIITSAPRQCYATIVNALFRDRLFSQTEPIHPSATVAGDVRLSAGVVVGASSHIGPGTVVCPNVVIGPDVRIGRHCVIKSGSVIGQPGFGIHRDREGVPHHLPHVGGVIIGDHVEIGALNTVASGTIHPTVIGDHVKTDDHVHIAHNCLIGSRTLLTACAELSGSVSVGADCWIGPNASVRDGLSIGAKAFVGIGSVVVKSVPPDQIVFGVPARPKRS